MPDTATSFLFGDGEYTFWLPLPQVTELQRVCGYRDDSGRLHPKSFETIFVGLSEGGALPEEANAVIRLGLIGGNSGLVNGEQIEVGPLLAKRLVETYGYPVRPFVEVKEHAFRILHAAIIGIDLKKKPEAQSDEDGSHPSP